jgi:hypothetical protein
LNIIYLTHDKIDKKKWDRCIEKASNGLIYAFSFYLDIMSAGWDALVMDDYEAVMPLTWNKKFGIAYLYQPAFTQQGGIFGTDISDNKLVDAFITKALDKFPFIEINLNYANQFDSATSIKCNSILHLNKPFPELEKAFRKDLVKIVNSNDQLLYSALEDIATAIDVFKENYSDRIYTPKKSYENLLKLYILLKKQDQLFIRKVSGPEQEVLALAIFLRDSKRIYYVMSATAKDGRKSNANYFLLYHVIKEFSGQNLIFDFEGSEVSSINFFFKKFGAIEQSYPFVRINRLPLWKRWIKDKYDHYKGRS